VTGFLNDLNLKDVPDDPNAIPVGKYPGFVSGLKINHPKDGDSNPHRALIITYKVDENHATHHGRTKSEFKTLPNMVDTTDPITGLPKRVPATPEDENHASYLKQRIKSLGVPEGELDNVNEDDLLGTPVTFEVKQRGEYLNIVGISLREEAAAQNIANLI